MAGPFAFDPVQHLSAASVGEPGNRFFFLVIGDESGWVRVWLEKEQLRALAQGFDELLAQAPGEGKSVVSSPAEAEPPDLPMMAEFHVGRLAVGYDPDRDNIMLIVHDTDNDDDDRPTLACRVTRSQAASLSERATNVCNAGRPLCPLCEQPMDRSGHLCPRSNGHKSTGL